MLTPRAPASAADTSPEPVPPPSTSERAPLPPAEPRILRSPLLATRCWSTALRWVASCGRSFFLSFLTSFFSSACAVCSGAFCCSGSGGLGGRSTRAKRSGSSSSDRSVSSGLGLSMMHAAPAKWRNSEAARIPKNRWSMLRHTVPRTSAGSSMRAASGRGETNWKSSVTSPSDTLPLADSSRGSAQTLPRFCTSPLDFRPAKSKSPPLFVTRPFIRSVKRSVYIPLRCSKTGKLAGSSLAGMTKVLDPSCPTVTADG